MTSASDIMQFVVQLSVRVSDRSSAKMMSGAYLIAPRGPGDRQATIRNANQVHRRLTCTRLRTSSGASRTGEWGRGLE